MTREKINPAEWPIPRQLHASDPFPSYGLLIDIDGVACTLALSFDLDAGVIVVYDKDAPPNPMREGFATKVIYSKNIDVRWNPQLITS